MTGVFSSRASALSEREMKLISAWRFSLSRGAEMSCR